MLSYLAGECTFTGLTHARRHTQPVASYQWQILAWRLRRALGWWWPGQTSRTKTEKSGRQRRRRHKKKEQGGVPISFRIPSCVPLDDSQVESYTSSEEAAMRSLLLRLDWAVTFTLHLTKTLKWTLGNERALPIGRQCARRAEETTN